MTVTTDRWTLDDQWTEDAASSGAWGDWAVGTAYCSRYVRGDEYAQIDYYVERNACYVGEDHPDAGLFVTSCRIEGPATDPDTADVEYDYGSAFFYGSEGEAQKWCANAGSSDQAWCFP